jgi:ribosome-associated protein
VRHHTLLTQTYGEPSDTTGIMADALPVTDRITIPGAELSWQFSRSGGPGGQHVNTTESRVQLRYALRSSTVLSQPAKERLRKAKPSWCLDDGDLQLSSSAHRSRHRNQEDARRRLADAIRAALVRPRTRRATKPSRGSKERRLKSKKQRSAVKSGRGRVRRDD